jgi:hypothetical protein
VKVEKTMKQLSLPFIEIDRLKEGLALFVTMILGCLVTNIYCGINAVDLQMLPKVLVGLNLIYATLIVVVGWGLWKELKLLL